jgi:hypothetical protein
MSPPPLWRLVLGFLAGPATACLLFASLSPLYEGLPLGERIARTALTAAFVVYPITLLIGVPTYLALKARVRPSAMNCVLAGAGVAALPWLAFSFLATPDEASTDGVVTAHHHLLTVAGWLELLPFVGGIALLGAVAGVVFWCAVSLGRKATSASA